MKLEFAEEQEMLRTAAREFLRSECPTKLVREIEEDPTGYSSDLWRKMADLGWLALPFAEEYGGGGSFLDVVALIEELGRTLAPVPYISTVVSVGMTIAAHGSEEQKQTYLPRIASGELIGAFALTEEEASYQPTSIATTARRSGDGYVLNGTKLFVPDGAIADLLLVLAWAGESVEGATQGLSLFLVDATSPGISREALPTFGEDRLAEVTFSDVRVGGDALLGPLHEGWPLVRELMNRTIAAQCMEVVGMAQVAFDLAVNYAKERVQFGQPIGSFQAIQHKCANMVIDVDGARFITYQAAWKVSEGLPADLEVSTAKAWVNEACRRVAAEAHQIHGGIGFTKEYDLQLYTRRIKGAEARYGDTDYHRELVAKELGL